MNPHERVASLPLSSHSLIQTQRRQRRRRYEEVENRHNAYNPCIFSPFLQFFFVHIMAFKWKLKDFLLLLRSKSEFAGFSVEIIRRKKKKENNEGYAEDAE